MLPESLHGIRLLGELKQLGQHPWSIQVAGAVGRLGFLLGALVILPGACGKVQGRGADPDRKLPVVWEAKGNDSPAQLVTEGKRPSVYRLDANGALVRRDARNGKVIWRRPAPGALRWTGFRVGRSHVALTGAPGTGSTQKNPGAIAALAIADGRLLWKKDHRGPGNLAVGAAGGGLFLDGGRPGPPASEQRPPASADLAPCDMIAVHPESGAEISSRFHGTRFFSGGAGIKGQPSCRHTAKVLDRRAGVTIIAQYQAQPRGAGGMTGLRLSAWADKTRSQWLKNLGVGPLWRVAIEPRLGVVSASVLRTLLLHRIDPQTGKLTWHQRLQGTKSCPLSAIQIRAVPGPAKRLALLAQRCGKVTLIDASTGKVHWERTTDFITAVVGERPHGWPPPLIRFGAGWQSIWFQAVRWLTPDGRTKGRTEIPNGTSELCLVPEGIVVGIREAEGTQMVLLDHQGRRRWSRPPSWESWLVYPYAIVSGSVIRIATGRVIGTTYPGKPLGLVPSPPILVVNDRGHLRGLRLR